MQNFIKRLDELARPNAENKTARRLDRIVFVFLALMVLCAPHSIAATQTAWLLGMTAWTIRLFVNPRPKFFKTPLNAALLAFVGWTILTAVFSYAPDLSLSQLRNVSVFLIFFFVVNNLRSRRAAVFLAFALVFSCMINVVWTPLERIVGRGVEIGGVRRDGILGKPILLDGDTILQANGKKVKTPEELVAEIERGDTTSIYFYRPDFYYTVEVRRSDLSGGASALERLGIESWKRSRNWRSMGFYNHWTTYSEVLQLIASLTFGLLLAAFLARRKRDETQKIDSAEDEKTTNYQSSIINYQLLAVCLAGMLFALLLTTTRASQFGFAVASLTIVWLTGKRKMLLIFVAVAVPLIIGGLIYLQQTRKVGFYDTSDGSITWRQTVYREAFGLWISSPRNFMLGTGMDSIKRYACDWHLFDDCRLPKGHFHSTPLQIAVERGLPALLLWFWIVWLYARTLWRALKAKDGNAETSGWREKGILLGCFGGLVGFFTGGAVHYNLGDTEVAMVFYILMGIGVCLTQAKRFSQVDNVRA